MSSVSMNAPTVEIKPSELQNIVNFIFAHETILQEFGGIKIKLDSECVLTLKKYQISSMNTSTQKITKVSENELIYSVTEREDINIYPEHQIPITNEKIIWSSLSSSTDECYRSGISIVPGKSFFDEKCSTKYFSIHSVPRQSPVKLGDSNITTLTRAHGPSAIFPLSSIQQRLSSLVYHHEGGARHWYIIPACERENLQKILQQQSSLHCVDQGQLLIDPIFLDKHHIRYYRLVQYPNEFVVLSPGALTQSFTEDASWTESINFALPNWSEENHANNRDSSSSKTIDANLLKPEHIEKYIQEYLNNITGLNPAAPKYDDSLSSVMTSPFSLPSSNEYDNEQHQEQLEFNREDSFYDAIIDQMSFSMSPDPYLEEYFADLFPTQENQSCQTAEHMQTLQNFDNNDGNANQLPSFNDYINMTVDTPLASPPIPMDTITENNFTNNKSQKRKIIETTNPDKTIFVSGLRNDVNKIHLYNHFNGCTKVILKQYRTSPLLKYAIIVHKTVKQAKRNFLRPINHIVLGRECHMKYPAHSSTSHVAHQLYDERTVVIKNIPENVSEDDLRYLFPNCYISKYSSAHTVQRTNTSGIATGKIKSFLGYAFITYDTVQEAVNVIKHANQYQINGLPLTVSIYQNNNQI